MMKAILPTASAMGLVLALSSAASAQVSEPSPPEANQTISESGLQDIVVTARRRSESVQQSSLAIEVLNGNALVNSGVTRLADLQNAVPSLSTAAAGLNMSTYIRGVGSFSTDATADSSIAYNINGVFISRPSGIGAVFFDLDRVEVLKGPQGTLYGRNASGGAINLITKRPTFETTGDFSADIGNYGLVRVFGAVGGPVSDTFAVRAAAQVNKHRGYLTDGYNDQDDQSARISGLWKPTDNFSMLVVGEYMHQQGRGAAGAFRSTLRAQPSDPWTGPSLAPKPQTAILGGDGINTDGFVDVSVYAINAEMNWDLGPVTLTFIPAYRNTKPHTLTYQPGFHFDIAETSEQQSYELRLAHDGNSLKWVAGLYYFDENQTENYTLLARPIQFNQVDTTYGTKSYAAFGEATLTVAEGLRAIGGIRYSKDKKSQDGQSFAFGLPTTNNFGRRQDDNVSFRLGGELDVAPTNMLFATVSTGYKAGGFVPSVPYPANSFKPETITAYTIGSRNRFFGNRLQVNAEGFYWNYRNKQERYLGALPTGGGVGLLTTNAGKATIYGANLDITAKIGRGGTLRANAEYLHTNYKSFSYLVVNPGGFAALGYSNFATTCALGPVGPVTSLGTQQTVDCAGKPLPHAPKWSGSVSYDQEIELGNDYILIPGVTMKYATSMFLSPDFIPSASDDGYVTLDANLTLQRGKLAITGWVRNITNEAIYSGGYRYPFSITEKAPAFFQGDPSTFYADIRPPRTYGVTLRAGF